MPKKSSSNSQKLEVETIKDIVKMLTNKKKKINRKRKNNTKAKAKKTLTNTYQTPNQPYLDSLGPKLFGGFNPAVPNLFQNPFKQPIFTQPIAAQPVPTVAPTKSTDWAEIFQKLVEAQTKAYKTPDVTPTTSTKRTYTPSSSSTSGYNSDSSFYPTKPSRKASSLSSSSSSSSSSYYLNPFQQADISTDDRLLEDIALQQADELQKAATNALSIDDEEDDPMTQYVHKVQAQPLPNVASSAASSSSSSVLEQIADRLKKQQMEQVKVEIGGKQAESEQPVQTQGYWIPSLKIWSTGLNFTYINDSPIGKGKKNLEAGQSKLIKVFEVGLKQDRSVWLKEADEWKSESSSLTKLMQADFEKWKQTNKHIFVFPSDKIAEVVPKAGRKAKSGY